MKCFDEIRNVNIEIQEGNPGASGLMWNVAQQTSIRNVTIDLSKSGSVGLDVGGGSDLLAIEQYGMGDGQGGGGTIEDVTIYGGDVGMRASGSQWTFRSIHIHDSKQVGLSLGHGGTWAFAILDLQVINVPVAVAMTTNQAALFIDCSFELTPRRGLKENTSAIVADSSSHVYLERVTARNADWLYSSPTANVRMLPNMSTSFYSGRGFDNGEALADAALRTVPSWQLAHKDAPSWTTNI
jgi:hypothetical protein